MADTLTPERAQQIQAELDRQVRMRGDQGATTYMRGIEPDELRALLLAYQRQQETREWKADAEDDFYETSCGRRLLVGDWDGRPCWCGRKVQVTR